MTEPQQDLPPGLREQLDLPHAGPSRSASVRSSASPSSSTPGGRTSPSSAPVRHQHDEPPRRPLLALGPSGPRPTSRDLPPRPRDRDLRLAGGRRLRRRLLPLGLTEAGHANIRARVGEIASRGIVPVILGGITPSPGRPPRRGRPLRLRQRRHRALRRPRRHRRHHRGQPGLARHAPMRRLIESGGAEPQLRAGRSARLLAAAEDLRGCRPRRCAGTSCTRCGSGAWPR